jgi:hypothetical protein
LDHTRAVDHACHTLGDRQKTPQPQHAEGARELLAGIGDERKIELQRFGERLVPFEAVEADAVNLGPYGGDVGLPVPEGACFLGSARGKVLRVKVEDVGPAAELRRRELPAVVERSRDFGNSIAYVEHAYSRYPLGAEDVFSSLLRPDTEA